MNTKNNKTYLSHSGKFKSKFQILYTKKDFNIKDNHLNYLFTKYKKKLCLPKNLDDIYDCCGSYEDLGNLCSEIIKTNIIIFVLIANIFINRDKKLFTHCHIVFLDKYLPK